MEELPGPMSARYGALTWPRRRCAVSGGGRVPGPELGTMISRSVLDATSLCFAGSVMWYRITEMRRLLSCRAGRFCLLKSAAPSSGQRSSDGVQRGVTRHRGDAFGGGGPRVASSGPFGLAASK